MDAKLKRCYVYYKHLSRKSWCVCYSHVVFFSFSTTHQTNKQTLLFYPLGPEIGGEHPITSGFRDDLIQARSLIEQWRELDENGFLRSHVNESTRSVFGVDTFTSTFGEDHGEDGGTNHSAAAAEDGNEQEHVEEQKSVSSDNGHVQDEMVAAAVATTAEVGNTEGENEEQEEDDGDDVVVEVSRI